MKASIRDTEALSAVSPAALSAYARAAGWVRREPYGDHSDVYAADGLPEIVLPRTQRLGDYATVVAQLIDIFARVADMDELALYRDLLTADRDVIRARVSGEDDGTVSISEGIALVRGAHDLFLAAACSLREPRRLYRAGANREATDYLRRVRLGQTQQGSFVVTLLPPVIPPPMPQPLGPEWASDPIERQMTKRLAGALMSARKATEETVSGETDAFFEAVAEGVSANLCDALVMLIEPFSKLEVSLTWARTHPIKTTRDVVRFGEADAPILREAARSFRDREPRPDERLFGFVHKLDRDERDTDGKITLRTSVDGHTQAVTAILPKSDYERSVQAHKERAAIVAEGDLQRDGQRWRLLNPRIVEIMPSGDTPDLHA